MADLTQPTGAQPRKGTWLEQMLAQTKQAREQGTVSPNPVPKPPAMRPEELAAGKEPVQATTMTQTPETHDWSSGLTFGTMGQPLSANPESGSILKILESTPGMKARIDSGRSAGHTFQIIHVPGSENFFLCETWNEQQRDASGQLITVPKKRYDPFLIKKESSPLAPETKPIQIQTVPTPSISAVAQKSEQTPVTQPAPSSSAELLRKKFMRNDPFRNVAAPGEVAPQPTTPENKKSSLIESLYKDNAREWEQVQRMPLDPFLHPEEYHWGTHADGAPITHTLEEYPTASRALRDKLVPMAARITNQGTDPKTFTVGQAIDIALANNLL
jgi:hypothetical protein